MKWHHLFTAAILLPATFAHAADAPPATPPLQPPATIASVLPPSFADLVEKLSPAVVNISTTQKVKGGVTMFGMPFDQLPDDPQFEPFRDFFERFGGREGGKGEEGGKGSGPEREVTSLGSGFIVEPSGYIITNNHVIDEADEVNVTLSDNSKYKATIVGRDKKTDLALLKVDVKRQLPYVPLGDSDKARVGDWVIAIGNPFGLGGSVTQGIISARQRSINSGPFDDFLQTDAPINRGNSGGPLFNVHGEVVGITSAIFSPSGGNIGIGFAIPTNLARPVIDQLKQYGRTHRGWLGVKIQEVSDEVADSVGLPKPHGALVLEISPGGPAEKAGLQAGDIITAFNGREVTEMRFLPRMVAETKIGSTVSLTYWRKGKQETKQVTLGELDETEEASASGKDSPDKPKREKTAGTESVLGMELAPLTDKLREEYAIDAKAKGVVVVNVADQTEADKRGFAEGDLIQEAGGEAVSTPAQFKGAIDAAKKAGRKFVLIKVQRGKTVAFVTMPVEEKK